MGLLNRLRLQSYSMERAWDTGVVLGNCGWGVAQNTSTVFNGAMMVQASSTWNFYAVMQETQNADYFDQATFNVAATNEAGTEQIESVTIAAAGV